jgi:hypothetical protein
MNDLGNNRPFVDVKAAAHSYLDQLVSLSNTSLDRVGLVNFASTGTFQQILTGQTDSPNYSSVRTKLNALSLNGWTNYEPGLKLALDEIQTHGRNSAAKSIVFLTDGSPNRPAPPNYYSYSSSSPERKCTDIVNNSSQVRAMCTRNRRGQLVCPVLPNSAITDDMISSTATQCAQTYVDYMAPMTNAHSQRANSMGVRIYTISIRDRSNPDTTHQIFRRLLKDPTWDPPLLENMASITNGETHVAAAYDATGIDAIYDRIAQEIRIKLTR